MDAPEMRSTAVDDGERNEGLWIAGNMAEVAINRIYMVYGWDQSVTNIINRMRRDCAQGGHPNLCV
jgi:hypothetical protein